jgi:hypothetical protein
VVVLDVDRKKIYLSLSVSVHAERELREQKGGRNLIE